MSWTEGRGYQNAVSVVVLIVLGAQTATLIPNALQRGSGGAWWPFLTYGMYATSNQPGQTIDVHYLLSGVTSDGREVEITREDLGLRFFDYQLLTTKLAHRDHREGLAILRKRYPQPLSEVIIKTYPLKLTREGAAPAPSTVVKRLVVSTAEQKEFRR